MAWLVSAHLQPLLAENNRVVDILVTVFSILAGFLVAIIVIVGDTILFIPGSWRKAELEREAVLLRLRRHEFMFVLYLMTLAIILAASLTPPGAVEIPVVGSVNFLVLFEHCYLFLGILAFVLSFKLPSALIKLQKERIDAHIEYLRKEEGIK
ncbi:MAG: hypothetical protein V2I38_04245 [Alcanivoracaceae bacterium]|nr:hypothetical protein [Alcanivoracaceae bacterium]